MDDDDGSITTFSLDRGKQALEDLGIGPLFLLRVTGHEADVMAERREAKELGIPLAEFEKQFPDPIDLKVRAVREKLLGEIRSLAPPLPNRGRNYTLGYLRNYFPELRHLLSGEIEFCDDDVWKAKLDEIIVATLNEPSWPIILGKLYGTLAFVTEALMRAGTQPQPAHDAT